jgi:hypothetical protein
LERWARRGVELGRRQRRTFTEYAALVTTPREQKLLVEINETMSLHMGRPEDEFWQAHLNV